MRLVSSLVLLATLAALWTVQLPRSLAQVPTEEELKDLERQAEKLEKKQAEAKHKAEAEQKASSALAGEFVDIPGGTFQMGCSPGDSECEDNERPVHTVSIKPFRMGKYEVTVGQFRRFVEAAGYRTDAERGGSCWTMPADGKWAELAGGNWKNPGFPQTDRDPVVCVSWTDAEAYAQWLSRQVGGRYRLPSESEWEYAVRAGSSARYGFGDSQAMLCTYGNVADRTAERLLSNWGVAPCDDGALYTAPVGSYRPNAFGLYDMHGNVEEWTEDCSHPSYAGAPSDGAAWTAGDCAGRMVRGGSWLDDPAPVRSRLTSTPVSRYHVFGFRLAQEQ